MKQSHIRRYGVLVVGAVAGALMFGLLVDRISPRASFDFQLSRGEIMDRAQAYLVRLGYDLKDYQQDALASFDGATHLYLQRRETIGEVNARLRRDSLAVHNWMVMWYDRSLTQSQNPETFKVWISPAGRPLGFEHIIKDSVSMRSIANDEAKSLAERFLLEHGVSLSGYALQTVSDSRLVNRVDHKFVWGRPDTSVKDVIWVRVQGDEVGGYQENYSPAGGFERDYANVSTTMTLVVTLAFAVMFVLFFYIVILFLHKYHEGEVGTRTAFLVFLGLFVVSFLSSVNGYPNLGATTAIGDMNRAVVRLVSFVLDVFILQLFLCVLAFAAWSVGESSARSVFPKKMTGIDSALFRRFFTVDLADGIIKGYAWGLMLLGGYGGLLYLYTRYLGGRVMVSGIGSIAVAYSPPLDAILGAFSIAALTEIIFRLFFLSYMREKTGKQWPGFVLSAVLWPAMALVLWHLPYGTMTPLLTFGALLLFGVIFNLLFLRYDLVTVTVANFVLCALTEATPLLVSGGYSDTLRWEFLGLLAVPLLVAGIGLWRRKHFEFTVQTIPRHIQRISERERMAKELEIARTVQMSLLPKSDPFVEGFDIAGLCIPAREVGGDYYDFVQLPDHRLGIALGDVSGKGVPAAIYMTLTKGILQSHAEDGISPKSVLTRVNSLMYRTIERNSFVSMFYAVLDARARTIRYARAGQCPVILTQEVGTRGDFLSPKGMALGLEPGKIFDAVLEEQELPLKSGQVMVFYTDGFTEAMTAKEEEFGEDRLVASVAQHYHESARGMIDGICADVASFTGNIPQHDDMTIIVVRVI